MSKELEKMNIISIVQKLKEDDVIILQKYIENLEKENEKLNHYKTLYQSLKRQKDIEIEELKEQLESSIGIVKHNMIIQKHVDRERKLQKKIEAIEKSKKEAVEFIINNISKERVESTPGNTYELKELHLSDYKLSELLKILEGVNDEQRNKI